MTTKYDFLQLVHGIFYINTLTVAVDHPCCHIVPAAAAAAKTVINYPVAMLVYDTGHASKCFKETSDKQSHRG